MAVGTGLIEVPGKWVLAGEHSVLRGGGAIALPHRDVRLQLRWSVDCSDGAYGSGVQPESLRSWLGELASQYLQGAPTGRVEIESTIPRGSGLGSSAALSVAVAQWLRSRGAAIGDLWEFARKLESRFHGTSSGLDIAAVMGDSPVFFRRGCSPEMLRGHLPQVTFHDTGIRASTRDCIAHVEHWRSRNPLRADALDEQMAQAVDEARLGFESGFEHFQRSFELSCAVFREWGLLSESIQAQARRLLDQGAAAVRLTGAGRGGTLVALWKNA